jgi:hypothetical protein
MLNVVEQSQADAQNVALQANNLIMLKRIDTPESNGEGDESAKTSLDTADRSVGTDDLSLDKNYRNTRLID